MSGISDSAKFNTNSSYYSPVGSAGPGGGVTSVNAIQGIVTINASVFPSTSIVASSVGQNVQLTTTGRPQAPTTVDATGAITSTVSVGAPAITASGALTGATLAGAFLGTTTGYNSATPATAQKGNIVIGNTRIQFGVWAGNTGLVPLIPITLATPYSNAQAPLVFVSGAYATPTVYSGYINTPNTLTVVSSISNTDQVFVWMTIGPVV